MLARALWILCLSAALVAGVTNDVRGWLNELVLQLPANKSIEMPLMGTFTLLQGHCTGMTVEALNSSDNSSGPELEFVLRISGIGLECTLSGESDGGDFNLNFSLARTDLAASVRLQSFAFDEFPKLPLPLRAINLTACEADIHVSNMSVWGNSTLVGFVNDFGPNFHSMVGGFINTPMCEAAKNLVEQRGPALLRQAREKVEASMLLQPATLLPEPEALGPLQDWSAYTPVMVMQHLVKERFATWSERIVRVLDKGNSVHWEKVFSQPNMTLSLNSVHASLGQGHPDLRILAEGSSIGLSANLSSLVVTTNVGLNLALPDFPVLSEQVDLTIAINSVSAALRTMVNGPEMNAISLQQVLANPSCLVQCTGGMTEDPNASIAVERLHLGLDPLFVHLGANGSLESELAVAINMIVESLVAGGYTPTLDRLANGALASVRDILTQKLWEKVGGLAPCGQEDTFVGDLGGGINGLWMTSLTIAVVGLVAAGAAHIFAQRRGTPVRELEACADGDSISTVGEQANAAAGSNQQQADGKKSKKRHEQTVCLACQPFIPPALAVLYPFALVSVIVMFAYADLALGASVDLVMEADGQVTTIGPFMSFSVVSTAIRSWTSGAYLIAVLTVLLCGIWPLVKLCSLMVAWLAPPHRFSVRSRGRVLHFLDTWGKYSFLDSWLLVLTMRVFTLTWESEFGNASIKLETYPSIAFYAFFGATTLSLVLGHIASECHIYALRPEDPPAIPDQGLEDSEASTNTVVTVTQTQKAVSVAPLCSFAPPRARWALTMALATSMVFLVFAAFLVDFNFKFTGVLPEFLFGSSLLRQEYNLVTIATSLATSRAKEAGLVVLSAVFLLMAFALPFVLLVLLLVAWLLPMKYHLQESVLHFCYIIDAWASLDVAVLVLVICCLEFGTMAEYLVYNGSLAEPCTTVRDIFHAECLGLDFRQNWGMIILIITGVLMLVVPKVTMSFAMDAIGRRRSKYFKYIEGGETSREQIP